MERQRTTAGIRLALKTTALAAAGVAVAAAGWWAISAVRTQGCFDLKFVTYEGARRFSTKEFERVLWREPDRDLWRLDLEQIRDLIESDRWVHSAVVRRRFPDTLQVYLVEREAVAVAAVDDELLIVDSEGVLLGRHGPDFAHLDRPILKGLVNGAMDHATEENSKRVQLYLQAVNDLAGPGPDYTLGISEISVEDPERLAVLPSDDPVPVYLGREGFRERYERFLSQRDLYLQLKQQHGLVEYVDVTYDNRVIFHTPTDVAG